ncbi:ribokinase [Oryzifoliimicrobium ureilyticus]|uniref:ribokinase n=1 Tax=Oryzifoliimicrobium ureilyticus TaxID=3113724 RepID=UPI00307680D3
MITVLGSINMDLVATTSRLPKAGETVSGMNFSTAAGGKGANQALAARRAGCDVRMVGAVGKDGFAAPAIELLAESGVDLSAVRHIDGSTGTASILVDATGENVIVVVPGANGAVDGADVETALSTMSAGDILMLQFEVPEPTVEQALKLAKQRGVTTILNLAPLVPAAERLGRMADIVVANETEFERLAGKDDMDGATRESEMKRLSAETGQCLIVTLGADGVVAIRDGELYRASGLVIEPVDTVGAGDTFCGYLAASLDKGLDFSDALRRAAVAGSLACLKAGAQPAIPVAGEVAGRL